ncbi:L-2-hydroxyglutarate oxidase [Geminocystis sp. CENA526]|uniref:L-2-hydroxyglutarate oxidase n=1 Tax=Geminocystis sp. CENA526 TaxID=1355871 RepID=UPI003D6FB9F2
MIYDYAIIGGGIVGLGTSISLQEKYPNAKIILVEKENQCAFHQTGHNSGVIHSGVYYKPGSYKAILTRKGNAELVKFCQQHNINYDVCGKLIVACQEKELPLLENLYQRGLANGIAVEKISVTQAKEIEPYLTCLSAIRVPTAGIVDYRQVAQKYAEIFTTKGGEIKFNTKVTSINSSQKEQILITNLGEIKAKFLINCAGLYSDRIAQLGGINPEMKIIPFRGEYYELKPEKRYLVKHLIYPVPNPDFPFLGVHFTRLIDGNIHAGPNAVLSLKREGYKKTDFDLKEFWEIATYQGLWKLVSKYYAEGIEEMVRSISKKAFVRSLQALIPEVQEDDIIPSPAGVRAQALRNDGTLVEDFFLIPTENALHVCNAPSPAATASLEIGKAICNQIENYRLEVTHS